MKHTEPMPGIDLAIFTFLILGGILMGAGIATMTFVPIVLAVLFIALGMVALFGMKEIGEDEHHQR